jgi:hypothetical protein
MAHYKGTRIQTDKRQLSRARSSKAQQAPLVLKPLSNIAKTKFARVKLRTADINAQQASCSPRRQFTAGQSSHPIYNRPASITTGVQPIHNHPHPAWYPHLIDPSAPEVSVLFDGSVHRRHSTRQAGIKHDAQDIAAMDPALAM